MVTALIVLQSIGDGCSEDITDVSNDNYIKHTYTETGIYNVTIHGRCDGFGYQDGLIGDSGNGSLTDVMEWDVSNVEDKN